MIKMLINGISAPKSAQGNVKEIMGFLRGKVMNHTFIVTDIIQLPVEGTETSIKSGPEEELFLA